MKLNILHSNPDTRIHERLGIDNTRTMELVRHCTRTFADMDYGNDNAVNLECEYKKLADFCNNIEEYTVCMHVFIFMLARKGKLVSELKKETPES